MQLNHLKVICMVSTAWLLIWFIPNSPRLVLGLINLFITFPILLMTSIYIIFSHARDQRRTLSVSALIAITSVSICPEFNFSALAIVGGAGLVLPFIFLGFSLRNNV